MLKLMKISLN